MSNKVTKVLALSLLSTIGLVACNNKIQAKPANYDSPVVALTESEEEIYHNLMSIIEDAYRDGTLPADVLDRILYTYSVSVFGRYNKVAKPTSLEETTLEEAVAQIVVDAEGKVTGVAADHAKLDAFIESHKAYWTTNNSGERVAESERGLTEYARVRAKWDTIEDRISRSLYSAISGAYKNDRGYFSEKKYLQELKSQMKHVRDYKNIPDAEMVLESDKVVVTPDMQEEEVFTTDVTASKKLLNRKNYQDAENGVTYIEDDIIPTIYRSLLVEQYLLDESYNNLGRSAARKVNVIAINTNSNNDKAANYLMKYFVRNVISDTSAAGVANEIDIQDFKEVSNAYKGLVDSTGKNAYLDKVNTAYDGAFPYDTTNQFYVGTDYGDMMANYIKIKDDINTTDSSLESDFTGSYTHTIEVGKEIKENDIKRNDYVTDGWFVKSGTVGDLPDSIKTRLFNIGIANVLDNESAATDRFVKGEGDTYSYKAPDNESKLVAKINGKYYLKVSSKQSGALDQDDILFNEGGKYYVVQVEEAVSGSKLAKESKKYDASVKEDIINEVARVVANNDTYQSASTKHWLEQAGIKYHDTKIYDYFKENYPDLFK